MELKPLKQDINLYLGLSVEDKEIWSWYAFKLLIIGLLSCCLLISGGIAANCFFQRSQIFYFQNQLDSLKAQLSSYANTLPNFVVSNPTLSNLEEVYKNRPMTTIEAWRTPYPFSKLFILLSQLIPETVWLNQIELKNQGNLISLNGFSSNEHDLQVFIQKLNGLKALSSLQLRSNQIERIQDAKNKREAYQFHIEVSNEKATATTA